MVSHAILQNEPNRATRRNRNQHGATFMCAPARNEASSHRAWVPECARNCPDVPSRTRCEYAERTHRAGSVPAFQDRHECFLGDVDAAHPLHALLAFLLLL